MDDLRKRILFTLFVLIIFRIGSFVPVPGVNKEVLPRRIRQAMSCSVFLTRSRGRTIAVFDLRPFDISIYYCVHYRTVAVDGRHSKFAEWNKQGEHGKKQLAQITRYGTVILGLIQALAMSIGFNRLYGMDMVPGATTIDFIVIAIVLTAGTSFLMWLGEQITERGIGNGISIIIFAGIGAGIPMHIRTTIESNFIQDGQVFMNILKGVIILLILVLIITGVVFIQQGIRKIPVQYAKRVVGNKMYGGQNTHIPLKINGAGVIPVIFAMSLLQFPVILASFWAHQSWAKWVTENLAYDSPLGMVLYVLMIIGFTFFYTFVQMNPNQMADNMKKNGGYVPGIRPGKATEKYLTRVMTRLTMTGALFLAVISVLPVFFGSLAGLPRTVQIGGTSLLIVVGVALDTMKQIESQLIKRHYKGFINK